MVYNACAEQRIYDLIEKASQSGLTEGRESLKQALKAVNQEFGCSHYGDLPEDDVKRIQVRRRIYEAIINAYELIGDLEFRITQLEEAQQAFKNI